MKKIIKNNLHFYIVINGELFEDDFTFGSLQAPTNLQVAVELIGKTAANPNGDGSKLNLRQLQMMQYPINLFFLMERLQTHQVVF
jgi:hypothetical protein